ncbi:MAG: threonine-phosphate decarboxylase [Gammaproteobacteria bacterium]|nr:MAG: threonine-phosphate decarboxylase [Gammaproteobacteria bacterium]
MPDHLNSNDVLHHGGRLRQASAKHSIPLENWLDLSTGINPNGWPVPTIPPSAWLRLPEEEDGLEQAACDYYGANHLLPVAGSQAAIQALPMLRSSCHVGVLDPGYAEHAHAWRRAGHTVQPIIAHHISEKINELLVLVLIHPNNPTGIRFSVEQLLNWRAQIAERDGWLVVDEAFMDMTPEYSLVPYSHRKGLIVLRSLGKFFGLAGARVGCVCAATELLTQLAAWLGPWALNAPARWVASAAFKDSVWQSDARQNLEKEGIRLHTLLTQYGLSPTGGCSLFQWKKTRQAHALHEQLASQGIFTRLFSEPSSLRFGLPANEMEWDRLERTLMNIRIKPESCKYSHEHSASH